MAKDLGVKGKEIIDILERSGISYTLYEGDVCPSAHFIMVPVGKGLALCPRNMRNMIPIAIVEYIMYVDM